MMAAQGLPVDVCCRVLNVSASGYYDWRKRPLSARALRDAWLTELIRQIHTESRGTYGVRRVHAELVLGRGIAVGRECVARLMRKAALRGVSGRSRFRRVPHAPTADDHVARDFTRDGPNQLWVTDITEHRTREGKVYCAVVLDAFHAAWLGHRLECHGRTNDQRTRDGDRSAHSTARSDHSLGPGYAVHLLGLHPESVGFGTCSIDGPSWSLLRQRDDRVFLEQDAGRVA